MYKFSLSLFCVAIFFTSACGGGNNSSNQELEKGLFSNSVMADPTLENGEKVEEIAATNQQEQYSLNAVASENRPNVFFKVYELIQNMDQYNSSKYALNEVLSESCDYGGSFILTSDAEYRNDANIDVVYNQCDMFDGVIIDGSADMFLSDYDISEDEYTKVDITYTSDFTMKGDDEVVGKTAVTILAGSTSEIEYLSFNIFGPIESDMTISAVAITDGVRTGLENANVRSTINFLYPLEMYYKSGRFYIDDLTAYAEFDETWDMSQTPFVFDSNNGELIGGEARFDLANGGKAKIVGAGGEPITHVDADGDGVFELIEN